MVNFLKVLYRAVRSFLGNAHQETAVSPPSAPPSHLEPIQTPYETVDQPVAMSLPPLASDFDSPAKRESAGHIVVHSKFGFHTGPGGNAKGIGDWFRTLDAAGIPFMIKSVDNYGPVFEASELAKKSGVEHVLVYRLSTVGQGHRYDYDVPPYKDPVYANDPEGAAVKHWSETKKLLPPEFDKERTWIEPINEVDKNLCDWLGRFGVKLANLARDEGYKVSLFAWSSGEPEREGWETPGMLDYLRLCGERPNQAAVALHEYSYTVENIMDGAPYKIGRFQMLFDVCDDHTIPRPTVHITEWGWTLDTVPPPDRAIADMKRVAQIYNKFPEIKGAAIWYLGPGFAGIANKAQQLIEPMRRRYAELSTVEDLTTPASIDPELNGSPTRVLGSPPTPPTTDDDTTHSGGPDRQIPSVGDPSFVVPPTDDESETTKPDNGIDKVTAEQNPPEPARPNARFVADLTIPDDTELPFGQRFTKTWRVQNSGDVAWDETYSLVHVNGVTMGAGLQQPLPPTAPGETADISIDFTVLNIAGSHFSDWRFQDPEGRAFGDLIFVRIVATPPVESGFNNSAFVADVTIPDDSPIPAGQPIVKTWRVKNSGTRPWNNACSLVFVKGTPMTEQLSHPLPDVPPGDMAEISIQLTAPQDKGVVFCDWRMQDEQGRPFGEIVYMRIEVV